MTRTASDRDRDRDRQTDLFSSNMLRHVMSFDQLEHMCVVSVVTVKHFKSHQSPLLKTN